MNNPRKPFLRKADRNRKEFKTKPVPVETVIINSVPLKGAESKNLKSNTK